MSEFNTSYIKPGSRAWKYLQSLNNGYTHLDTSLRGRMEQGASSVLTNHTGLRIVQRLSRALEDESAKDYDQEYRHPAVIASLIDVFSKEGLDRVKDIVEDSEEDVKAIDNIFKTIYHLSDLLSTDQYDTGKLSASTQIQKLKDRTLDFRLYMGGAPGPTTDACRDIDDIVKSSGENGEYKNLAIEPIMKSYKSWVNILPTIPKSWRKGVEDSLVETEKMLKDTANGTDEDGETRQARLGETAWLGSFLASGEWLKARSKLCKAYDEEDMAAFEESLEAVKTEITKMKGWVQELYSYGIANGARRGRHDESAVADEENVNLIQCRKADPLEKYLGDMEWMINGMKSAMTGFEELRTAESKCPKESENEFAESDNERTGDGSDGESERDSLVGSDAEGNLGGIDREAGFQHMLKRMQERRKSRAKMSAGDERSDTEG